MSPKTNNQSRKKNNMKKYIITLLAIAVSGFGLSTNAAEWQDVAYTRDGKITTADAGASSDGYIKLQDKAKGTYYVEISYDDGNNWNRVISIEHDSDNCDFYPVLFPISKGQIWRVDHTGADRALVITSAKFYPVIGTNEERVAALEALVSELSGNITTIQGDITTIKSGLQTTNANVGELQNQMAEVIQTLQIYSSDLVTIKTQITTINTQISGMDLESLQNQIETLTQTIDTLQTGAASQIAAVYVDLASLQTQIDALKNRKSSAQNDDLAKAGVGLGAAGLGSIFGYIIADDDGNAPQNRTKEAPKSTVNTTNPANSRPVTSNTVNTPKPINSYSRPADLTYPLEAK